MSYKTILVHIDQGKRCAARVQLAIRLARQYDALLVALYAIEQFEMPGYVVSVVGHAPVDAHAQAYAAVAARAEDDFAKAASAAGISKIEWRAGVDDPVDAMTLHARYADLLVIGQTDATDDSNIASDFPERLVLAAGRPVLIVPSVGEFPAMGKRILVAWNASREATRAVTDAIPLLRLADQVHVMAVNPRNGDHGNVPGANIGLYLARHGVRVEVKTDLGAEIDVGNELLSRAADLDVDLIVMGGYGHSRLQEWVLGGATRTILKSMTAPVLMSH